MTAHDQFRSLWDRLASTPAQPFSFVTIPQHRMLSTDQRTEPFLADRHYFQVRINQIFLRNQRHWFTRFDPMVFVATEFTYDRATQLVPYVVGPHLMQKHGMTEVPNGTLFSNTRVAGTHPYRGGRLVVSIVLCQLERENYARNLLSIVEKVTGALDFGVALSTYVKLSGVILDGLDALMGAQTTKAVMGMIREIDPEAGDLFEPGYFVLLDSTEVDVDKLWIRDGQLKYGSAQDALNDFREEDFVLFSIMQSNERADIRTLPFYSLYERAKQEAAGPETDSWQRAKALLCTLYQNLILSADLVPRQADSLNASFVAELKRLRQVALENATLGAEPNSDTDIRLQKAAELLDL